MKIIKYPQSCLLVETKGKKILIDPGTLKYKEEYFDVWNNVDIILITHKHPDHCNTEILEKIKKDFYFVKVIDKTEVKLDFDKISEDYSIKGVYAKKLLEKMKEEDCDKEILQMALKLGIQSLSHEEVNLNDYK